MHCRALSCTVMHCHAWPYAPGSLPAWLLRHCGRDAAAVLLRCQLCQISQQWGWRLDRPRGARLAEVEVQRLPTQHRVCAAKPIAAVEIEWQQQADKVWSAMTSRMHRSAQNAVVPSQRLPRSTLPLRPPACKHGDVKLQHQVSLICTPSLPTLVSLYQALSALPAQQVSRPKSEGSSCTPPARVCPYSPRLGLCAPS